MNEWKNDQCFKSHRFLFSLCHWTKSFRSDSWCFERFGCSVRNSQHVALPWICQTSWTRSDGSDRFLVGIFRFSFLSFLINHSGNFIYADTKLCSRFMSIEFISDEHESHDGWKYHRLDRSSVFLRQNLSTFTCARNHRESFWLEKKIFSSFQKQVDLFFLFFSSL